MQKKTWSSWHNSFDLVNSFLRGWKSTVLKSLMFKNCDNHGNVFATQSLQFHITGKASSGHPYQEAQHPLPRTYSTFAKSTSFVLHYSQMEGQHPSSSLWSLSHSHWLSQKVYWVRQTCLWMYSLATDWETSVHLLLQDWWHHRGCQELSKKKLPMSWGTAFAFLLMFLLVVTGSRGALSWRLSWGIAI